MSESPFPDPQLQRDPTRRGSIAWMVRNRVTPNLIMLVLLLGGFWTFLNIKKEVFPEFTIDTVTVRVPYPGASPEEVENGIVLAIEEEVRALEGVKEIQSSANEGSGTVTLELMEGANRQKIYQDVQAAVSRITTFPDDAEEPEVELSYRRHDVMDVLVYGDVDPRAIREAAEMMRDGFLQHEEISQIEFDDVPDLEVHVEVSEEVLRRYGLTLQDIADKINQSAIEIPGGRIETAGGEILLRIDERRDWAREYAQLVIVATPEGSQIRLGDIATVWDGFEDVDDLTLVDGKPAINIEVYRIGDETPISVADATKEVVAEMRDQLPPGVELSIRRDDSETYRQRLSLLLKNAVMGLALVLLCLGLFLEFKLAFWVTMGIPISFLGGMLFLPFFDVSFNMITMFAFIIALGIVVDDAIVVGENIYEYRQQGMGLIKAAIKGAQDVCVPVIFAILTNVLAFSPLAFVPGFLGKIWGVIPIVVCTVFLVSLIEALIILPAHLAHTGSEPGNKVTRFFHHRQQAFSRGVSRLIDTGYAPFLKLCIRWRFATLGVSFALLVVVLAYVGSGRIGFVLMPRTESDQADVTVTLPPGSPMERSLAINEQLTTAAQRVIQRNGGEQLAVGTYERVNDSQVRVTIYLTEPGVRPISTTDFAAQWREEAGAFPDARTVQFESDRGGPGGGAALTVELSHRNVPTLNRASQALADRLATFTVTNDIDAGFSDGKPQLNFRINALGESLGLTAADIARQVRSSFQGNEAIKQQRGREEVTVRVRRPEAERESLYELDQMILRTPDGGQVLLRDVAEVEFGRAYTSINRRDGRRTVAVTANVEPQGEITRVQAALDAEILPQLARDFPGLSYGYEGRQAEQEESFTALRDGLIVAMLCIYFLLAIPFRSYIQPAIVMAVIPFGLVGAIGGHLLMGYSLSIISVMGIVALAGVVVNDSLVLIEYTNRLEREEGLSPIDAIQSAGVRRFRPILLTTLTTFGGLAPMIFETSRQARFMIPMAISLGFGILFATVITLVILPCLYVLLQDIKRVVGYVTNPSQSWHDLSPRKPQDPDA